MNSPTASVRGELERWLAEDSTRLGDVYRLTADGLEAEAIAARLGVRTHAFVSRDRTVIETLLSGTVPRGAGLAKSAASRVRARLKDRALSGEARAYLSELLERLAPGTVKGSVVPAVSKSTVVAPSQTLRDLVDAELRGRTTRVVATIREQTHLDAADYMRLTSAASPLNALVSLIEARPTGGTTEQLQQLGQLQLSLEQAVLDWAEDLPLTTDVVENARARLNF